MFAPSYLGRGYFGTSYFGAGSRERGGFASYVFDATEDHLYRILTASGDDPKLFTISMWVQRASGDQARVAASVGGLAVYDGEGDLLDADIESVEQDHPLTIGAWEHWVTVWDSTETGADNRLRFYKNGVQQPDTGSPPDQNEEHALFVAGATIFIGGFGGSDAEDAQPFEGKIAFIDVLDGVAAEPTAFAFRKLGVWTRKTYRGPYGTCGFSLDGSDRFHDVSGNGQHFTSSGIDLDTDDLPPYGEQVGGGKSEPRRQRGTRKKRRTRETEAERKARERAEEERRDQEAERQRKKRREREKAYQDHLRRDYERRLAEEAAEAERLRLEAEAAEAARLAEIAELERETAEMMAARIASDDEEALLLLLAA